MGVVQLLLQLVAPEAVVEGEYHPDFLLFCCYTFKRRRQRVYPIPLGCERKHNCFSWSRCECALSLSSSWLMDALIDSVETDDQLMDESSSTLRRSLFLLPMRKRRWQFILLLRNFVIRRSLLSSISRFWHRVQTSFPTILSSLQIEQERCEAGLREDWLPAAFRDLAWCTLMRCDTITPFVVFKTL